MIQKIYVSNSNNADLNMYKCGIEDCRPYHFWGPAVRDHFLIHFILRGKGIFKYEGIVYNLEEKDVFLICPGKIAHYYADEKEPWTYAWIGFNGVKAEKYLNLMNLSNKNPVKRLSNIDIVNLYFDEMLETKELKKSGELKRLGFFYVLISEMIEQIGNNNDKDRVEMNENYINKALLYFEQNYFRNVTVVEIANYLGIDRSYFSTLFKKKLSISPKNYLIKLRVEKACELMKENSYSIGDISRSVGYEDQLLFSKIFKKIMGICPKKYREKI
jgi:AraC-like DNA-binding protein